MTIPKEASLDARIGDLAVADHREGLRLQSLSTADRHMHRVPGPQGGERGYLDSHPYTTDTTGLGMAAPWRHTLINQH